MDHKLLQTMPKALFLNYFGVSLKNELFLTKTSQKVTKITTVSLQFLGLSHVTTTTGLGTYFLVLKNQLESCHFQIR